MRKRVLLLFSILFAAALSVVVYRASQNHPLPRPKVHQLGKPPQEYEWEGSSPPCTQAYVRPLVERYLQALPTGSRLLDLGCGNGAMLGSFSGKGWQLVGVDISNSGIAQARKGWPGIQFEVGDATGDLSALGQFDAVISTEVIEHIFLPRYFAQNCFRLLKPGGILVLSTPYHGWLKNIAIAVAHQTDKHFDPLYDYGHIKFWSVDTLSKLLWEAGFDDLEFTGAGRLPYLWKSLVMRARKPVGH